MRGTLVFLFYVVALIFVGGFITFLIQGGVKEAFGEHPLIATGAIIIVIAYFNRNAILLKHGLEFISFTRSPIKFLAYKLHSRSKRYEGFRELFTPSIGSEYSEHESELSIYVSEQFKYLEEHFDFYTLDWSHDNRFLDIQRVGDDILAYNGDILSYIKIHLVGNQVHNISSTLLKDYLLDEGYDIDDMNYKCHLISKQEALIISYRKLSKQTDLVYCTKHFLNLQKSL